MAIFDPKSRVAEEFINDQEIRDTLAYAEEHKSDVPLLMSILDNLKTVESTLSQIRRRRARGTSGLWPSSP